jgi:hypothetical protein
MADAFVQQSERTFRSVRKPAIYGAVFGALFFALISFVLDHMLQTGQGGMGLAVISGSAFGGLLGLFVGLLRSHGGRRHGA